MPNILIIVPDDRLGGAEQYLKNIAVFHADLGHSVNIIFLKRKSSGEWNKLDSLSNVSLFFTNSKSELYGILPVINYLFKIRNILFNRIYTSHLHVTSLAGVLINLGIIKKKHFIARESTSYFLRFRGSKLGLFKLLYRLGYRRIDLLICQSDLMKIQLLEGLPWIKNNIKVVVLPNPLDLKAIHSFKFSTNRMHSKSFIVSAGRLIPEKGYDILINAFADLRMDFADLDLIILGEGEKRTELEAQISNLNLGDRVFMIGRVTNVYDYFRQARLCVVSSRVEGFPNVLLQMMSLNNTVVSTKCAGGIEDIKGIICSNANDVASLTLGLRDALSLENDINGLIFNEQLQLRSMENFYQLVEAELNNL